MNERKIPHRPLLFRHGTVAAVLGSAALAFGWTASGTVKSTTGTALADVAVTVKDSASYNAMTSANGAFTLGSPTGIRLQGVANTGWNVRMAGGEMEVRTPADGPATLALLDLNGRSLWAAHVVAQQGLARTAAPAGLRYGAAILRARQADQEFDVAVTTGPEGTKIASHIVAPRSMAMFPVLQFKKSGYNDTTYAMTSDMASGLAIAMSPAGGDVTTCPATKLAPVDKQVKTITVKGVSRSYILHVPSAYKGDSPVPLVVDFHPIGGSADNWFGGSPYKAVTDPEGVISVYPDGKESPWNLGGTFAKAWNVKGCCTTADDTAFARALVAEVKKTACIDPKRVYATGFSMGGGMTHFSACHLADIFAAAAPAAFDLLKENVDICKPSRPITMIMFRGTKDGTVPYDASYSAVVPGMAINFLGAKPTAAKWAELNKCTGSISAEDGNGCATYSNCADGVQVTLCTKQGGQHEAGNAKVGWPLLKKYTLP